MLCYCYYYYFFFFSFHTLDHFSDEYSDVRRLWDCADIATSVITFKQKTMVGQARVCCGATVEATRGFCSYQQTLSGC